jgi:ppGpp synthetase/RelA/SpoT-type nucleotidyltranferase
MNSDELKKIEDKVNEIKWSHQHTLTLLIGLIEEELKVLKPLLQKGTNRFVAEIENKDEPAHQVKSLESIVEKIKRSNGKYTCENFSSEMTDILRDRIICNYLSDIKAIAEVIQSSEKIDEQFEIIEKKDTIYEIRMEDSKKVKGVRAYYFVFKKKNDTQCPKIEIQIMTMLSWAWDKKDHYLIYEQEREGFKVSPVGKIKMNAMSELLYVADEFFDSIQQELSQ